MRARDGKLREGGDDNIGVVVPYVADEDFKRWRIVSDNEGNWSRVRDYNAAAAIRALTEGQQ